jgi:CRISPR-associated protein Cmr4
LIGETTKLSKHDWSITQNLALVHPQSTIDKQIYLEEFDYRTVKADPLAEYVRLIEPLIFHPFVRQRLPEQLVVIADREFHYFARFSLPIQSKNHLGENKASGNVWQEENLPADTLLYSLLMPRYADPFVEQFYQHLVSQPYLQVGGNESTGLGWFALQLWVREGAL